MDISTLLGDSRRDLFDDWCELCLNEGRQEKSSHLYLSIGTRTVMRSLCAEHGDLLIERAQGADGSSA